MSSDVGAYIDGQLMQRRRLSLDRFSAMRDMARATHLSAVAISRIEQASIIGSSTTLAELNRIAAFLGVPLSDLLARPDDPPPAKKADLTDAAILGRILTYRRRLIDRPTLADELGWTLSQLREAQRALDAQLRPLGMHIHEVHTHIRLEAIDTTYDALVERVEEVRIAVRGLHLGQATMIRRAMKGELAANTMRAQDRLQRAALVNQNTVCMKAGNGLQSGRAMRGRSHRCVFSLSRET